MVSHLVFYQLGLIALVWVFLMLSGLWPSAPAAARPRTPKPLLPRCQHSTKPKPLIFPYDEFSQYSCGSAHEVSCNLFIFNELCYTSAT